MEKYVNGTRINVQKNKEIIMAIKEKLKKEGVDLDDPYNDLEWSYLYRLYSCYGEPSSVNINYYRIRKNKKSVVVKLVYDYIHPSNFFEDNYNIVRYFKFRKR